VDLERDRLAIHERLARGKQLARGYVGEPTATNIRELEAELLAQLRLLEEHKGSGFGRLHGASSVDAEVIAAARRCLADVARRCTRRPQPPAGYDLLIIRPDVCTAMTANAADEQILHIRQPQAPGPAVGVDLNRMRAIVATAQYVQSTEAGLPQLSQGDLVA
jgi:hypothetical protein